MPTSAQIRRQFIDYFVQKHAHAFVPSSPVVPLADPTLLFTNAGMNQFKPYFLGTEHPAVTRVANTQKCIRAGGKHNDLEDVGKDTYHHTFFEMLGNWSFGDYFKKEAIAWAWDLLTTVWGIDPSRLHATYFQGDPAEGLDPDTEARDLWLQYLPKRRIHPGNKKDNFWEMGDTGPCGPCSEIHIDRTPDKSGGHLVNGGDARVMEIWNLVFIQFNRAPGSGGKPGPLSPLPAKHVDTGMGFERICAVVASKDRGYDPNIGNYDTDVFTPIFTAIQQVTGARPYGAILDDKIDTAYRVIGDHIRTLTFALTDGATPGNEGRNYVLRRILRRAARHGWQTLGQHQPFLFKLVPAVVDAMGEAFPELKKNPQRVADLIREEEESFGRTLGNGIRTWWSFAGYALQQQFVTEQNAKSAPERLQMRVGGEIANDYAQFLEQEALLPFLPTTRIQILRQPHSNATDDNIVHQFALEELTPGWVRDLCRTPPQISAVGAFKLHDTYGFSLDLTQVMAEERGLTVDVEGFKKLMDQAKELSRAGGSSSAGIHERLVEIVQKNKLPGTQFLGYETSHWKGKTLRRLFRAGDLTVLYTGKTPFYAEQGGQVGDTGNITWTNGGTPGGSGTSGGGGMHVSDTQKVGDVFFHIGMLQGQFPPDGDEIEMDFTVNAARRDAVMANHTTTHVMNRALRVLVNPTADQRGSLVDDEKLRFDFSHGSAVTAEEIEKVERMVNADIAADLPVHFDYVPQEQALKIHGLRAVFGEKYPPVVRVVSIGRSVKDLLANSDNPEWGKLSIEFCGGTHLPKTGDAEGFAIVSEEAVGKGVRRITALTGATAHKAEAQGQMLLSRIEGLKNLPSEKLPAAIAELTQQINTQTLPALAKIKLRDGLADLQKIVKEQQKQQSKESAGAVVEIARAIADKATGQLIVEKLTDADADALRQAMDVIRKKCPDAAILLGAVAGDKVSFVAAVPDSLVKKGLKAGDWVREVAKAAGGGGGGRPDMAQAGGKDPTKIDDVLAVGQQFASGKIQ